MPCLRPFPRVVGTTPFNFFFPVTGAVAFAAIRAGLDRKQILVEISDWPVATKEADCV